MIGAQPAACLAALGSIALAPRVSYWVLFVAMLAARAVSRRRYFANQLALGLALNVFRDRQRDRVKRPSFPIRLVENGSTDTNIRNNRLTVAMPPGGYRSPIRRSFPRRSACRSL